MRRAYTLIEMGAVSFFLALLATIVVGVATRIGNAREEQRQLQAFVGLFRRASATARLEAHTVRVRLDRGEGSARMEITEDEDGGLVLLPPSATIADVREDRNSTRDMIRFFSDGTADITSILISSDEERWLRIARDGTIDWGDEPLPQEDDNEWQAGDFERRA